MGKDLGNVGKAVLAPPKTAAAVPAPSQPKPAAAPEAKVPAGHEHSSAVSNNKDSRVFKAGMFSEGQIPAPVEDSIALEDLPEKTDIQEVPAYVETAAGGSGVDVDGDGTVDVRYRQRY